MGIRTKLKFSINKLLKPLNLSLETLTARNVEFKRLRKLEERGEFEQPVFPLPAAFQSIEIDGILQALPNYRQRFEDFESPERNDVSYSYDNPWFTSPDAEILYTIVRIYKPARIIEVGSGHSTKVIRQAIIDGKLNSYLISIDPNPRIEIDSLVEEVIAKPVETVELELFRSLNCRDILFIDSSHEIKPGNDVVFLYLKVIPLLKAGVLVHIHDIFLPYEYPKEWILDKDWGWNEQYLLQGILMSENLFKIIWPGYFLQRTREDFDRHFLYIKNRLAQSFWIEKTQLS